MSLLFHLISLICLHLADAATVTYDFNITWLTASPDGVSRPVIGINGQWPIPQIDAMVNDTIIVNLNNQLGNESTSLHFHGIYMNGTNNMDGVPGTTQCAVPPGNSFTYKFTVNQVGTYWYHSHSKSQYPDGLRGPLIIHDPDTPFKGQYDEERVLTLSDWYHDEIPTLMSQFINLANPTGAEPVPDAALMNDTQNLTTPVEPGKTYMFHIINMGAFAAQYFWFENHTMQVVEVDGIYTEPADADMIYVSVAQRYTVLVTAKNDTSTNFAFVGSMDQDLFDTVPPTLNPNVTGWLIYNGKDDDLPDAAMLDSFEPFDDLTLVPHDKEPLLPEPDQVLSLTIKMDNLGDGANYAFINDQTYVSPKVPTVFSALSSGNLVNNTEIYGPNTNAFLLDRNQIVQIELNNNDPGKHPFHLHGHNFQAIARSGDDEGDYVGNETFPAIPMRRDTLLARPNGNFVIRFRADNPGIWLFHCHIEWHLSTGLVATMLEAPSALQSSEMYFPADHYAACALQDIPTTGNAAGNSANFLDLTGAFKSPAPLPAGFTPRGIVALTFSIISGLLGIAVVAWYGAGEITNGKAKSGSDAGLGRDIATAAAADHTATASNGVESNGVAATKEVKTTTAANGDANK